MKTTGNPRSTVSLAGHPIHVMLVPFVIGFYTGAFGADVAYAATQDPFWARAAIWLIGVGIIMSAFAATVGFIDFIMEPRIRDLSAAWWHLGGNILLSAVSIVDWFLRYEEGNEAGSHHYIWLSLAAVLLLLFNGWKGWEMVYSHKVGVAD
jgi:uncharacterized membrane protein